jgi:phosphate-selective porin OprO/OprP
MTTSGRRLLLAAAATFAVASAAAGQAPAGAPGTADAARPRQPSAAQSKPKEKPRVEFVWVPHPSLRAGKQLRIDFRARVAGEKHTSDASTSDQPGLDRARKRIGVEGEVLQAVGFQIERELTGDDPWRDVYANYQQFHFAQAQVGKFKLPFGLEENTSSTNLDFAYRSLAAATLSPGRDRGWMLHGQVLDHGIGYEYGVFDHDGRNARSTSGNRVSGGSTTAYRITTEPFRRVKSKLTDLQVGYAATDSDLLEGFSSIRGQTVLGQSFYRSNYLVNGARRRTGYELRWRPGPASLKWESIRLTEERLGESVEDSALSPLVAKAWYVSGTFAVTGESKSKGLDEPRHPLLQGGVGAVEVAFRVERITFGSEASEAAPGEPGSTSPRADVVLGNSDRIVTLGVNWYANRWVKLQVNLIKEQISDPSQGPLPGQPSFWSRVIRFQVGF